MNQEANANQTTNHPAETSHVFWRWRKRILGILSALGLGVLIYSAMAIAPQPVLRVSDLGNNQFLVAVTNGVSTTNYTLFWREQLENPNYPWRVLTVGSLGQSNFTVDAGLVSYGFFRVLLGADGDADGIQEWQDAQPLNPYVGLLNIMIDSPTNNASFN